MINGPRLEHPHRNYILFSGPLMAALEMGYRITADPEDSLGNGDPPPPAPDESR